MNDEARQKSIDYKSVFTSEAGTRILKDLDGRLLYKRDLFDSCSARVTDFNLGMNAAIRYIHSWIDKKDESEQVTVINEGVKI